jgi:Na+-driven multidrug efflux pump
MALGGFLNIGLDAIFVPVLGLGAAGAGIATCISNIISMLYLYVVLRRTRDSVIDLRPTNLRFERYIVKQVILVGIPAAAIIILGSSANAILTHYMSDYGDVSIAAYGITQKIGTVGIQITIGLTQGIMPLLGYCYGAGETKRLKDINRWSFILLGCYAAVCMVVVMTFADTLVRMFISEPDTVEKAVRFLRIWFFCAPGMCFTNLFSSIFQAMGKWIHSLALSVIRQIALLIPLLAILSRLVGETGLICAQPAADTVSLLVGIGIYISLMKQLKEA